MKKYPSKQTMFAQKEREKAIRECANAAKNCVENCTPIGKTNLAFIDGKTIYDAIISLINPNERKSGATETSSNERVMPLYPSKDFKAYVADQKRKGLMRRYWKNLPKMWEEELNFRREIEDALNGAA